MGIRYILLTIFLVFGSGQSFAQYSDFKYKKKNHSTEAGFLGATKLSKYISGGLGINLLTYFGDLTPNEDYIKNAFKVTRPGISGFVNYNYSPNLFFTGELLYGRITGDDFNADPYKNSTRKYIRNLNFRNDLVGLTMTGNYNIFKDPFEFYKRRKFNIYFTAGLSIYYSNPKGKIVGQEADESGKKPRAWIPLRPLGTEGQKNPETGVKEYSAVQMGIPFGGGVRIRLGYRTDLYLEAKLNYILSDFIDDIGTSYIDLGAFGDDDRARKMSDRSKELIAPVKEEERDREVIRDNTTLYSYVSEYNGETYIVYKGFGQEGAIRGGPSNDLFTLAAFKFSYIFTK